VGLKKFIGIRLITMFGVLMATLLLTIILVGSNMVIVLKKGIGFQVTAEITENPAIAKSFSSVAIRTPNIVINLIPMNFFRPTNFVMI